MGRNPILIVRRAIKMMAVRVCHFTPLSPLSLYVRLFTANIALYMLRLGSDQFFDLAPGFLRTDRTYCLWVVWVRGSLGMFPPAKPTKQILLKPPITFHSGRFGCPIK
jgi:hypothetical protein